MRNVENRLQFKIIDKKVFSLKSNSFLNLDSYEALEVLKINNRTKIKMKHNCGYEFITTFGALNQHRGCPICRKKNSFITLKQTNNEKYTKLRKLEIENNFKDFEFIKLGKVVGSKKYIILKHKSNICNYNQFEISITDLRRGRGCPICNKINADNKKRKGIDNYKKEIYNKIGNEFSVLSDKLNKMSDKVLIQHNSEKCNQFQFLINARNFKNRLSCPACSESSGERVIRQILKKYNIDFTSQKIFKDCKDKGYLKFDFYIESKNTCIEFDGIQHFQPVLFNGDLETAEKEFKITQYHDKLKNEYCKQKNINLIRINYKEFNKIEDILKEKINLE